MDNNNGEANPQTPEVAEIVSAEPVSEASVSDIVEAAPGCVLAQVPVLEDEVAEDDTAPSPLEGEGQGEGDETPTRNAALIERGLWTWNRESRG